MNTLITQQQFGVRFVNNCLDRLNSFLLTCMSLLPACR